MNSKEFRNELKKIMPGYRWTVRRQVFGHRLLAEGVRSSGFNRTSTLIVGWLSRSDAHPAVYEIRAFGYGLRSEELSTYEAPTLAKALRGIQKNLEHRASVYQTLAQALQDARE